MPNLFEGIPRKALTQIFERGTTIYFDNPFMLEKRTAGIYDQLHNRIYVWDGKPETMAHEVGHALTYHHRADPILTAAYPGTDGERGFLEWCACNFAAWVRNRKCHIVLQAWFEERYGDG